jgi:hypothetical protein
MNLKVHASLLAVTASLVALLVIAPVAPAAQSQQASATSALSTSVTGTAADPTTGVVGTLTGTLTITGFTVQNGVLAAVGTLTATVKNAAGDIIATINQVVTIPLQNAGTCPVLHLELGPVDLNLLGLMVHLDRVVLDITAQSGPGNLLGNLLCAVTHLLDSNGPLSAIQHLLDQLAVAIGRL